MLYVSVDCAAGNYKDASTGGCKVCPVGSYQSSRGQDSCILCPKGTKTVNPGSISDTLCVAGDIDRCVTGANDCDPVHATCSTTQDWFLCSCKEGYLGDGKNCTGEGTYSDVASVNNYVKNNGLYYYYT